MCILFVPRSITISGCRYVPSRDELQPIRLVALGNSEKSHRPSGADAVLKRGAAGARHSPG